MVLVADLAVVGLVGVAIHVLHGGLWELWICWLSGIIVLASVVLCCLMIGVWPASTMREVKQP